MAARGGLGAIPSGLGASRARLTRDCVGRESPPCLMGPAAGSRVTTKAVAAPAAGPVRAGRHQRWATYTTAEMAFGLE